MNAIELTTNPASDYRAAMQQAAVAYLYRHRCEHLAGDSQLLENCTGYLTQSLEVPTHLVQWSRYRAPSNISAKNLRRESNSRSAIPI